jgi:alpha-D-ribose 1-methylphosphonate 5-triphosphate synthase subunit PhnG
VRRRSGGDRAVPELAPGRHRLGRELCAFLDRLVGQLRRRANLIVCWQPIRNVAEIRDWLSTNTSSTAVRFLTLLG